MLTGRLSEEQRVELEKHLSRSVKSGVWVSPLDYSVNFTDENDNETVELISGSGLQDIMTLSEDMADFHRKVSNSAQKWYERKFAKPSSSRFDEYGRYVGDIHV